MSMTLNMITPPVMTGLSSRNDWIGTNESLNLLTNYQTTRSWDPYPLQNVTFWASGNSQGCIVCSLLCHSISSNDDLSFLFSGMHIMKADSLTCRFKLSVTIGLDISIYLGFATDQTSKTVCYRSFFFTKIRIPTDHLGGSNNLCVCGTNGIRTLFILTLKVFV